MIKVAICGAFSTGKTTLCTKLLDMLAEKGYKAVIVEEAARSCPYQLNEKQNIYTSLWLAGQQIKSEAEAYSDNPDVILCDRSFPDILSHTSLLQTSTGSEYQFAKILEQIALSWCSKYDLIFSTTINPDIGIKPDKIRSNSNTYRSKLEEHIAIYYERLGLSVVPLSCDLDLAFDVAFNCILNCFQ